MVGKGASLVAQTVKHLPAVREIRVWFLGQEDPLEKEMAIHSSTLAWKIPWTEEPGRLQSMGSLRVKRTERLHFHLSLSCIGEGNANPLQCSCLENPRDGGAWWAAVYGVAQSRTRLKRLSSSSNSQYQLTSGIGVGGAYPDFLELNMAMLYSLCVLYRI